MNVGNERSMPLLWRQETRCKLQSSPNLYRVLCRSSRRLYEVDGKLYLISVITCGFIMLLPELSNFCFLFIMLSVSLVGKRGVHACCQPGHPRGVDDLVSHDVGKNGIPFTFPLTNEGGRTYFNGQNWIDIATKFGMQPGKSFLFFLNEFEEGHPDGNKIYLWYGVPQSP